MLDYSFELIEFIVSVGQDGSIFIFETPMDIRLAKRDYNKPQ